MADKTANEELRDALIRHQIYLLAYAGGVRNRIFGLLDRTEREISGIIRDRLDGMRGLVTPSSYRRMETAMRAIAKVRGAAWERIYEQWAEELVALVEQEPERFASMVITASPAVVQMVAPAAERLRAIALSRPFQGRILRDWANTLESADLARIQAALQQGLVSGLPTREITRLVIGTAAMHGADGVTEMTRHQVNSVVRTAVMHVASYARNEMILANQDLFDEELFFATLDSRTTPVCRAQDGKRYKVGEGPHPPLHYGCRSLRVPVIGEGPMSLRPAKPISEKQILREYAREHGLRPVPASRRELPRGHKSQFDAFSRKRLREMTGRVPSQLSYNDWLKSQSATFQDDVLGKTKALLFRKGELPLDRFVDRTGQELTLAELARKEAAAFRAAGLNPEEYK